MKFFIKDLFSKCDQIRWKFRIRSHLLKKSLMEKFIFCAVNLEEKIWDMIRQNAELKQTSLPSFKNKIKK